MTTRILLTACLLFVPLIAAGAEDTSPVGKRAPDFALQDYRGKQHKLADYRDSKLVVLAFLGTECPLVKLYAPRLAELSAEYEPRGVTFLAVNANRQDSISEIAAYARRHKLDFPILKDTGNKLADQLAARRTPEVFVLDDQRVVRYHGRIDDQYGVGYIRDEAKRHDLRIALDELLAGKAVSTPETQSVGCFIGRIRDAKANSPVTYANQIARILQDRCVECHREGEIAPFTLTDYDEVVGWGETIAEVVRDGRMPPWHANPAHGSFRNDRHMSDREKQVIFDWVKAGCPQGDLAQLPKPKTYVTGWDLPRKPDLVLDLTKQPFRVPAEGEVKYQYFAVNPGFKEDKWIQAAQIQPGNRAVVHHTLIFARTPGGRLQATGGGARGFLVGYVPGMRSEPYPLGMAKRLPAGSQLVVQMHYTPIGTEQFDQSKLGLVFADPKDVKYEVQTTSAVQRRLSIPPGDDNYQTTATNWRPLKDCVLLSLMPHMHLRGKAFRYEVQYPDGKSEILLDIPAYDFNWQTAYRTVEPKPLPAGTRVKCTAWYDNSEANLNNPDPAATVHWGDQTWDEMMIGYFDVAVPVDPSKPAESDDSPNPRVTQLLARLDANGDGKLAKSEVPNRFSRLFDRFDRNSDGQVTAEELTGGLSLLPR